MIGVFASGRAEGGGHPLDKGGSEEDIFENTDQLFLFSYTRCSIRFIGFRTIFFSQSIFQPSEEEKTSLSCGKISKNVNQVHLFS